MNYRNLEVWQFAHEAVSATHGMMRTTLPKFEMLEKDGRIRRAIKLAKSIVEDHGDRRYKQELVKFVDYALASSHQNADQLDMLLGTKSLTDIAIIHRLTRELDELGRKMNLFLKSVEREH